SGHGNRQLLALLGGEAAKGTNRYLRVLRLDGGRDVRSGQLVLLELERVQPDAHGIARAEDVDAADPFQAFDLILDLGCKHVAEIDGAALAVRRYERAHHQDAGGRARNL